MARALFLVLTVILIFPTMSCALFGGKGNVIEYERDRATKNIVAKKTVKIVSNCFPKTVLSALSGGSFYSASGSGVILKSFDDKSYILTANHVVSGDDEICRVSVFRSGDRGMKKAFSAKILVLNKLHDIALLRVSADFGVSSSVATSAYIGEKLTLAGFPGISIGEGYGADKQSISINSGEYATNVYGEDDKLFLFRFTADAWSGYSGGPLFNLRGDVVGVTSFMIAVPVMFGGHPFLVPRPGFYFARPYNRVRDILTEAGYKKLLD